MEPTMETQTQASTPKDHGTVLDKTQWTVFELETIHQILNSRGQGAGIKDVRLISRISNNIKRAIPERPAPPAKAKDASEESKKAYMESIEKWQKDLQERVDTAIPLTFSLGDLMVIRAKVAQFNQYSTDEDVRERLVTMFDKLGVE